LRDKVNERKWYYQEVIDILAPTSCFQCKFEKKITLSIRMHGVFSKFGVCKS
jgi:hypothetical protein